MSVEHADALQDLLERDGREHWPLPSERAVHRQIAQWRAFRESDAHMLRHLCDWHNTEHRHREYLVDPLPERIADAFADLIFGAEPEFDAPKVTETAPDDQGNTREVSKPGPDQELLDDLVDENDLPSELQDAASRAVGEGEAWWRIYVDRDAFEHPVVEWHSRDAVVPLWRGKKLLAVAFVNDVDNLAPDAPVIRVGDDADPPGQLAWREGERTTTDDSKPVYRYIEIQTGGLVRNLLFRGERDKLGQRVALTDLPEYADLPDEWPHGLEAQTRSGTAVPLMLAGRVANGRAGRLGRSQYTGVKGLLFELNKLQSVGSRNVDLTMQKRAVIGSEFAQPDRATLDEDGAARGRARVDLPDAFLAPQDSMGEGEQYKVLEFSDAWADALLAWDGGLTDKILTRCRVAPQLVGRHTEDAATGPALRARLLDSILAANGKANAWLDALPKLLRAVQMVDALPEEQGGCGHDWANPEEPPTVKLSSVLPEDETDEVTRHVAAVGGEIEARRTAIETWHPEWDAERVDRELELIRTEQPAPVAPPAGGIRVERPPITLGGGNGAGA
jgi:hypothetical protein